MPEETGIHEIQLKNEKRNYMLSPRPKSSLVRNGLRPLSALSFNQILRASGGIEIVRRIKPSKKILETLGVHEGDAVDTVVVRMEPERANSMRDETPELIITEDKELGYGFPPNKFVKPLINPLSYRKTIKKKFRFLVTDKNNAPVPNVSLSLAANSYPVEGFTDEEGKVEIEINISENTLPRLLMLNPPHTFWNIFTVEPELNENEYNNIKLTSLKETFTEFPQQFRFGWGQLLMGLDKMPNDINGAGIKIAIIDSGCDNSHPLLQHIVRGKDLTSLDSSTWNNDTIGHGTHCAGIIAARSNDGTMMRGFAPEAEIHILRMFPAQDYSGFSHLKEALEYCIEHEIDVINLSLGTESDIEIEIENLLEQATQNGIACIASAGNSGEAVFYPASSPHCLAVSAIGNINEVKPFTWEATTIQDKLKDGDIFSPNFTCFGSEVDVCAPGVSIVSTVPGGMFKADNGTSMAAPHVTGLAALLLAHHPLFKTQFKERDKQRVETLYDLIRSQCKSLSIGEVRVGIGLPQLGPVVTVPEPVR
ncbi:S8 family serine peptidase [Bacillus pumilus]|uniref:S8 family serine peptidase n=1 Tax=Bacillus pumilus TaxID=1408 RepID=UPI00203B2383|nr:S8 family serine peptidase [Bacillus pumilus]MCM3037521.1 S8 family serine peptidase [Bacillus pumilus]